ncbi:type 1 glutamine amidotransferase domain-containing protein [Thalassotalea psychrophila]|uniref:Type 1 glutamine amidotransferase domain-containing protein n=1 Tax=Thalassotalea psychrophila TaxID=3065647 RepID=A0ABY9TWM7_9GAMM|nr:type 1 glutamine amidotransferase domain-containing protein [Colwelliaceae bacterium SQ149]
MNIIKQQALVLITLLIATFQVQAETSTKKVLMIVSGNGQGEKQPGYEFDEFSKAYTVFNDNGVAVDIASPKGGHVEADKYDPSKSYNAKVLDDQTIMAKLNKTLATGSVDAKAYDAVFVVGGKGAMFDLPKDTALQNVIAQIYQQQGSVAAVCHGPAALVNVKLKDGSYLVANKAINSFTNQEEKLFGQKWINDFDFMLEDKLTERGAKFQSSEIMLSHVAVDGRLITGQNPTSTVDVATALVKSLGLTPVKAEVELEDKTMAVIAKFIAGDQSALDTLAKSQEQYHIPLVGMYGFYFLKVADTTLDFEQSLALMLVAQKAINSPNLDMQIAKTQSKLGQTANAKATLNQLITAKPDFKPAQDMLKTL